MEFQAETSPAVEGGKQPYAIARVDGQPMAFAGLWEGFRLPEGKVARGRSQIFAECS